MTIRMPTLPARPLSKRDSAALSLHRFTHTRLAEAGREERRPVCGTARVYAGDGAFSVELINLSRRGCAVLSPVSVLIGTKISMELPLVGMVAAQVRWSLGGRFGTAFTKRLSIDPLLVENALLRRES